MTTVYLTTADQLNHDDLYRVGSEDSDFVLVGESLADLLEDQTEGFTAAVYRQVGEWPDAYAERIA